MKHRLIPAFFLIAFAASAFAVDGWQMKDAVLRISVSVRQDAEARYFIPMPTEGDFNCTAFNADGTQGSAATISLENAALGFRVVIPPAKSNNKHAYIYLSPAKDGAQSVQVPEDERPFKVTRNIRTVTTRAFTANEIMGYFGELQKSSQFTYVKNAGEIPPVEQWQLVNKTHIAALLQWETLFVLDKDAKLAFGSKQPNIAWAMLVDGKAVADWHASVQGKDGSFCEPVEVPKGIHTFQMLVIQRFGEPLPQALVLDGDGVRAIQGVSAPDFPGRITVEFADKEKAVAKANYELSRAYGSITTAKDGGMGNAVAFAKVAAENAEFMDLEGRAIAIVDSTLIWDASFTPGVRVGAYHFRGRRRFMPAKQIFIRPRITNAPNVLPFGGELELDVSIDAPGVAESILKFAEIAVSYSDKDGRLDVPSDLKPLEGRRRFKIDTLPMSNFGDGGEMPLFIRKGRLPTLIEINIGLLNGSLPIAVPARLRLVHPRDIGVSELRPDGVMLTAIGEKLYHDDIPATFVCARLPKEAISGQWSSLGGYKKFVLLDAFTENIFAPKSGMPLDELLAAKLPEDSKCLRVTVENGSGTSGCASMLASFGKVMAERPDMVILLNGASSAKSFGTPMEATSASIFMVQACFAHCIMPVLVTMPALPGVDAAAARLEALYLKEMATALGVHVIDLYSMDVMGIANARKWYNSDGVMTATPNDRAREWLATQLAKEIMQIINSTK